MTRITIERETLLPCPFCGDDGDKGRQEVTQMIEGRNKFARITCRACGAMCPEENWNRRAALAAQPAEPAEQVACKGIPRKGCNYLAYADTVCNKCGEIHWHHQMLAHFYAAPAAVPEGYVLVPDFRGYANLGTGQYLLNISGIDEPPELIISIATNEEKSGRTVGDLRDNPEGTVIQPEQMAVRLRFASEAGLAALEQHLRILREERFAAAGEKP